MTAKPKVMENLKRSWKVMDVEELKRVRTLYKTISILVLYPCDFSFMFRGNYVLMYLQCILMKMVVLLRCFSVFSALFSSALVLT